MCESIHPVFRAIERDLEEIADLQPLAASNLKANIKTLFAYYDDALIKHDRRATWWRSVAYALADKLAGRTGRANDDDLLFEALRDEYIIGAAAYVDLKTGGDLP